MTIREAIRQRIRYVRLPHWEPPAHVELPLTDAGGLLGPWATVRDVTGETQVLIPKLMNASENRYVALDLRAMRK